jgi:hypothetical protein
MNEAAGRKLAKKMVRGDNHHVGGPEITAGCEHRFTPQCCERINRAVAEVELGSVTHALPEASKRGDRCLRLGFVERNNLAAELLNEVVQS